jgi:phage shock protein E
MRTHHNRSWSRPIAAAVMAVAAITATSACSSGEPVSHPTSTVNGQHMSASDFSAALEHPGRIVLDVRTPAEFASGHLPNAQNVDFAGPDFATRIAALDKKATYAVYCRTGKRSSAAMEQMAAAGFIHAFDLAGGIVAWQEMGGPMATGAP